LTRNAGDQHVLRKSDPDIEGTLPKRALNLVLEWAIMHGEELLDDWQLSRENVQPAKIEPLP
jgi:Domain of unknown function (DUF4160)